MQISRIKILSVGFFPFLISQAVFAASVVESEFEMLLPRKFQQNLIEQSLAQMQNKELKFSWPIPNQNYNETDLKVDVTGISLDVTSGLEKPVLSEGGKQILLRSQNLQATLKAQSISIDQVIEREVGGVIGRFRVQAQCENVTLNLQPGKGSFAIRLTPVFSGSVVKAQVENVDITWTSDAWSMGNFNCTGTQGFDETLKKEVLQMVADPTIFDPYKGTLKDYVQKYLDTQAVDLSGTRTLPSVRSDIKILLRITGLESATTGLKIRGAISFEFARGGQQDSVFLSLSGNPLQQDISSGAILRLNESLIPRALEQAFLAPTFVRRVNSNDISAFRQLMRSRLLQILAWPELTKFSRSANFLFDIFTYKDLKLSGEDLKYHFSTRLNAQMYAPKRGQYVPFMAFDIPLSGGVDLSVADGKMTAKLTDPSLNLYFSWDEDYVRKYHACKRFARSQIQQRLRTALQKETQTSFNLPAIPLMNNLSLQIDQLRPSPENQDLLVYLKEPAQTQPALF